MLRDTCSVTACRGGHARSKRAVRGRQLPTIRGDRCAKRRVFYKITAHGREYNFNLSLNTRLLSRDFITEAWGHGGVKSRTPVTSHCHYVGYSSFPYKSKAAMSNCWDCSGVFSTEEDDYFVEPLWNYTQTPGTVGYPHVVYSRSSLVLPEDSSHCGVRDYKQKKMKWLLHKSGRRFNEVLRSTTPVEMPTRERPKFWRHFKKARWTSQAKSSKRGSQPRRRRRSVSKLRNVETLVVVDKRMVAYHQQHEIEPYVLTIMNIVAKLFQDPSIGNSVNIIVTRLVLLSEDQPGLEINHHADRSLDSFCRWQQSINSPPSSPQHTGIAHHDNAILITRFDICTYKNKPCGTLGLAPVAGMCEEDRSCSINEDIGLASAFTIAHEIGHNFGMHHDGAGNPCGTPGHEPAHIMAARLTKDTSPFLWSSCSREYITSFMDSGQAECLENKPPEREFEWPEELPGERHDANRQCLLQFGHHSRACKLREACRELWCYDTNGKCITNSIPAAEGTECPITSKKNGWCYRGVCQEPDFEPQEEDGEWGPWTGWGECSRTCGGGVAFSSRECNNPAPRNGGKYCLGERKRYRSCNILPCLENATDFREAQCTEFNTVPFRGRYYTWKPYTGEQRKPCALICLAEGFNFYTERASKVKDGTRCYPDKPDVCINGECHPVGCDGILHSPVREDSCRVCGGDGSSCQTISGLFDKPLPKGAYQEVVKIPKGAIHVQVKEADFSSNYLALKSSEDKYYINGDWTIDWPRKFPVAGTVFHYELADSRPESMRALGPTNEDLVVMILIQEDNRGIQYQYNLPVSHSNASHDVSHYTWHHSPWSACSKSCARGMSESKARCMRKASRDFVEDALCFPQPRPSDHRQYCNQDSCPPQYKEDEWSACSVTCGRGVQERGVSCVQVLSETEEVVLDLSECPGSTPSREQSCHLADCPHVWFTDEWSECNTSCGPGEESRRAFCMTSDGLAYMEDTQCPQEDRPATRRACSNADCPPPSWMTGDWGQCSVTCGRGSKRRNVQCRAYQGQPSNECQPRDRPALTTTCESPCQADEEDEECEDKYKVAYCPLVKRFKYCDREYFQKMCCHTCRGATMEKRG